MKYTTQLIASCLLLSASSLTLAADDSTQMPMQGQMPMHGQMPNQAQMQQHMQNRIKQMDTNGDGNISQAEFMANCEKKFKQMDVNGDGQISPEERAQMKQKYQKKMMQHQGQQPAPGGAPATP